MIRHIVCFKLKEGESAQKAADILRSMKGRVPSILEMEVGVDFLHSPRSCDVVLSVVVSDADALNEYQADPYHCSVVKKHMHAVAESSVSADYIIEN